MTSDGIILKYTEDLKKEIDKISSYITVNNHFYIIGSFGRKGKYITDVDINNNISLVDKASIDELLLKIKSIVDHLPKNTIFLYLTSGFDKRYKVPWEIVDEKTVNDYNQNESLKFIKQLYDLNLINEREKTKIDGLLERKGSVNNLILIEDILYGKSKMRWNKYDIKKGEKMGIKLEDSISDNDQNILHYIFKYDDEYIPIDVGLNKKYGKSEKGYVRNREYKFDKRKYLTYLKKEYYFILWDLKRNFRNDKLRYNHINFILENKFGPHKQIMVNLFYLDVYIKNNTLSKIETIKYTNRILQKIKKCTDYKSDLIHKLDSNKNLDNMNNLIKELEEDILNYMNKNTYSYACYYLSLIDKNRRPKYYYLAFDTNMFK